MTTFLERYEAELIHAEDIYRDRDHRQRTLFASIDTSVRYLSDDLRALLSGLWIFRTSFLPEMAAIIFAAADEPEGAESPVPAQLHALWRRGLLVRETMTEHDGSMLLYRLLPTVRPYTEQVLPQAYKRTDLLARYGAAYARLAQHIYEHLNRSAMMVRLARETRDDLEQALDAVAEQQRGW